MAQCCLPIFWFANTYCVILPIYWPNIASRYMSVSDTSAMLAQCCLTMIGHVMLGRFSPNMERQCHSNDIGIWVQYRDDIKSTLVAAWVMNSNTIHSCRCHLTDNCVVISKLITNKLIFNYQDSSYLYFVFGR